jgi:hypothetical protein
MSQKILTIKFVLIATLPKGWQIHSAAVEVGMDFIWIEWTFPHKFTFSFHHPLIYKDYILDISTVDVLWVREPRVQVEQVVLLNHQFHNLPPAELPQFPNNWKCKLFTIGYFNCNHDRKQSTAVPWSSGLGYFSLDCEVFNVPGKNNVAAYFSFLK